jgi:hypothetical protein
MATTTNYGWTTPDDTALVKDGAAAIRTLGSSVDTTTKNLNPETTLGDIAYRSSTANVKTRLGIGSSGQFLSVSGGVPAWVAAPAGKIIQVVSASTTTAVTIASTSFTDSGLSGSITPTLSTSKILVMIMQPAYSYRDANAYVVESQILRGATQIAFNTRFMRPWATGSTHMEVGYNATFIYLDSPATTSATTYKTQFKFDTTANGSELLLQHNSAESQIILMEIGA